MPTKLTVLIAAALFLILAAVPAAFADDDGWHSTITLYGWLSAEHGTVSIGQRTFPVDFTLGDAVDALKHVDKLFMAHYEGTGGRWRIIADYSNLQLSGTTAIPAGPLTAGFGQKFIEFDGSYLLSGDYCPTAKSELAVLAGARYARVNASFGLPGGAVIGGSKSWTDPLVGLTYRTRLGPQWGFGARGDVGGFGISSHLVTNLIGHFTYDLSNQWAIDTGWRWLIYNYNTGEGRDRFAYDMTLQGPFLGLSYGF